MELINTTGRRKTAIARVFLSEGSGKITINKKDIEEYFPLKQLQYIVRQPIEALSVVEKYDISATLTGGGYKGQAEAMRMAIARALVEVNPEDKTSLKSKGFLTRDSRKVERKKPGQPGARKRFQFSKR